MLKSLKNSAFAVSAGLIVVVSTPLAEARPDARTQTCSQVQALLEREGAATISTGDNTFERYVSSTASCPGTSVARRAIVATSDTPQCEVRACESRVRRRSND